MSLFSKESLLARIRRSKDARSRLVESNLAKAIAYQIRATREAQNMTQTELASATRMSQNNISRLENPDYGKHTSSSLKRIAEALDVAVIIRLVPFSQYVHWLSGEAYLDEGLRPEALAVPNFVTEEKQLHFNQNVTYYKVYKTITMGKVTEAIPTVGGAYSNATKTVQGNHGRNETSSAVA